MYALLNKTTAAPGYRKESVIAIKSFISQGLIICRVLRTKITVVSETDNALLLTCKIT